MVRLCFGVLGPLEIHADGRSLVLPAGRRRAVLGCLLVRLGQPVPADTLIEAGWGDEPPRDSRAALNTVISRLRSIVGSAVLRAEPAGYVLGAPGITVGAQEFEELRRRAESAEPREAGRLLSQALGLWRGPAYVEFADREFALVEAQRLDQLRLVTIESRAGAALDDGDNETAIGTLEGLLVEHPFREHALELLLTALYHAGRQTDALDRYHAYRALLADELGLDPSPALTAVLARILGHELVPARRHPQPPAWLDTTNAFVGREEELDDLVAVTATNRLVTVTGPGGVGKSRLVAQALPLLSERLQVQVTVAELAAVSPGRVNTTVAETLGLRPDPTPAVDRIVERLSADPLVLVLDNCEHLLDEVAPLAALLGRKCPHVHVLATSRRRLGTTPESVLPLRSLTVPEAEDTVTSQQLTPAVRLFVDRVRRLRPTFGLTSDNTADIAVICRQMDGIPLALELAAARTASLGVVQVRELLSADVLGNSPGDLSRVVAWSYRLLTAEQRQIGRAHV